MTSEIRESRRAGTAFLTALILLASAGLLSAVRAADTPKNGDADNGKKLYAKQKCDSCHMIGKKGSGIGPELTREGTKRDAEWLAAFLKSPKSKVPKATMPAAKGPDSDLKDLAAYLMTLK